MTGRVGSLDLVNDKAPDPLLLLAPRRLVPNAQDSLNGTGDHWGDAGALDQRHPLPSQILPAGSKTLVRGHLSPNKQT